MSPEQAAQLIEEVAGVRRALEVLVGMALPASADEAPACAHPIESRADHSAMGQARYTHYTCTACGAVVGG